MTGLRARWSRSRADTRCQRHGLVPRVHDGCMKCGAGTVTTPAAPVVARRPVGVVLTTSGVRTIDLRTVTAQPSDTATAQSPTADTSAAASQAADLAPVQPAEDGADDGWGW